MPANMHDVVIVGGGHNGLVAACYLARAGFSVCVLERYHEVGGAAFTQEIHPGYLLSEGSYVLSLMPRKIIDELGVAGDIQLVFFRAAGGWVEKLLPVGEERYVSGEIGFFNGFKQITHPDFVVEPDKFDTLPLVQPVYPLTHGLSSKALGKVVQQVVGWLPDLSEWMPEGRRESASWWTSPAFPSPRP